MKKTVRTVELTWESTESTTVKHCWSKKTMPDAGQTRCRVQPREAMDGTKSTIRGVFRLFRPDTADGIEAEPDARDAQK